MPTSSRTERDVIARYKAGDPIGAITEATGIGAGTVYWILRRNSVQPSRQTRTRARSRRDRALDLAMSFLDEEQLAEVMAVLDGDGPSLK